MSNPGDKYIIDGMVVFDPEDKSIYNLLTHKKKKMHATCTRCLILMLENPSRVISQSEFLLFAWPDTHNDVSYNTFYQCILNLRRSFSEIKYEPKLIITVPRKGLCLSSSIDIVKTDTQTQATDSSTQPKNHIQVEQNKEPLNTISTMDIDAEDIQTIKKKYKVLMTYVLPAAMTLILVLCILLRRELVHESELYISSFNSDKTNVNSKPQSDCTMEPVTSNKDAVTFNKSD
ncbi:DNA-binding winged helix-turn-helix (wHTH) protein [Buttiauxella sp. JUb87]|uniref:winged helix-turn-helix domain-containing protein n=1 Tax=Buttiauxella sp. JUb87 TaxID=2485129 RepID=UPI001060D90B|nr:winged helix-turn-helix domain-containing protein [Buttiauxella sp. JUb87]TDN52861.1 DNA-binding winged helix-turn-helix (wHTH) protein [Buttiauxella sp. JUb87]